MDEILNGELLVGGQVYFDRIKRRWIAITYFEKLGEYLSKEDAEQAIRNKDALLLQSAYPQ